MFASYATDKFYGELCVVEVAFEVDEVYFEGESVVVVDGGACADVGYAFVLACYDFVDSVGWYEFLGGNLYVGCGEAYLSSDLVTGDYWPCNGVGVAEELGGLDDVTLLDKSSALAAACVGVWEFVGLDYLYACFFAPLGIVLGGAASVSELVVIAHDEGVDIEWFKLGEHKLKGCLLHHVVVEVEQFDAVYSC